MTDSRQPAATLTVARGPEPGRSFTIGAAPATIGREAQCEIQVGGTWVSRRHARITWTGTGYVVEDLGSTNGTYVNDEPVRAPRPLRSGDLLQLGRRVELTFEARVPAPVQAQPMPAGITPSPAISTGPPPPPQVPPSEPVPARQEPFLGRKSTRVWGLALLGLLLIVIIGVGAYYLFADDGQQVADRPTEQPTLPQPTSTPTPIPPTPTPSPVPGGTITGRAYLMDR